MKLYQFDVYFCQKCHIVSALKHDFSESKIIFFHQFVLVAYLFIFIL